MRHAAVLVRLAFSALAVLASPLFGQEVGSAGGDRVLVAPEYSREAPQYGTASQAAWVTGAVDFLPRTSSATFATSTTSGLWRYATSSSGDWFKSVDLPNGALIERVELHACDETATGQMLFGLARTDVPGPGGANATPVGSTGLAAAPGCALFSVTPTSPPLVVDNTSSNYSVFLNFSGDFSISNRAGAFRVIYRLQVSPAPGVATFTDVPTNHAFFRFVEALASAGITGGCGGGLYCPNSPVTRGQMAVFLSVALGLHFPY